MSIDTIRAAARTRVLTASEISQLRGADPYGRLSSQVKNQQMQAARAVAVSSPNKGGASAAPVVLQFGLSDIFGGLEKIIHVGGKVIDVITGGTSPTTIDPGPIGYPTPRPAVPTNGMTQQIDCLIPGQRVDPVTGECRFFLGEQSGPDTGGQAVVGAFGLPAMAPAIVGQINGRPVRRCRKGSVLGTDELCYPKAVLPPRSKFRKWKRPPRPAFSRRDEVAIRRAAGAKDRVLNLAREAGLHASLTKPKARARAPQHHHHPNGSS